MKRRQYIKSLSALPILPSIDISDEGDSEEWNVRGVWKRRTDTGLLHVRSEDLEAEFESYTTWGEATMDRIGESDKSHVVNLFDFDLISIYDGAYCRSHFAHDCGLEATIKQEPEKEVEFRAFVRHVGETWEEARRYASDSQIALASKLADERDEYL